MQDSELSSDYYSSGDEIICYVTPNDGEDDGAEVPSNAVTVDNSAPSIDTVSISPDPGVVTDTLECSYEGFDDADDGADESTYSWTVDGVEVGTDSTLSGAFVKGDTVTCTVTPYDGSDEGDAVSAEVEIINTAPSIDSVAISPDPVYAADTLSCAYVGWADDDGDGSESTYLWEIDGVVVGTASTLSGVFVGNDEVSCTVTPTDDEEDGTSITETITVTNTPPVLADVTLDPDPVFEGDTFTCTVGATTDDDGTTSFSYSYAWTVDGVDAGVSDDELTAAFYGSGDEVICYATPNDGEDDGDQVASNAITVENTAPSIDSVTNCRIRADGDRYPRVFL